VVMPMVARRGEVVGRCMYSWSWVYFLSPRRGRGVSEVRRREIGGVGKSCMLHTFALDRGYGEGASGAECTTGGGGGGYYPCCCTGSDGTAAEEERSEEVGSRHFVYVVSIPSTLK